MFRLLQEQNDGCDRGEHTSLAFFAQHQHVFCRYWACYIVHVDFADESSSAGLNSLKKEFDKISERLDCCHGPEQIPERFDYCHGPEQIPESLDYCHCPEQGGQHQHQHQGRFEGPH